MSHHFDLTADARAQLAEDEADLQLLRWLAPLVAALILAGLLLDCASCRRIALEDRAYAAVMAR